MRYHSHTGSSTLRFSRAAKWFNARRVTRFNIFVCFPAAGRKDPCGNAPSTSASIVAHHISEVYHFHLRLADDDGSILLVFILDVQIRRAQQCRCQRIFQIWTDISTFFFFKCCDSVRVCVYKAKLWESIARPEKINHSWISNERLVPPPRALAAEKPAQAPTQKDEDGAMEKKKRRKNYRWIDERKSSSSDVYKKWRHDHPVRHLFQHLVGCVFLFFFIFPLVVDCFLFDFLKSFLLLFKRCFFYFVFLIFSFFEFASPYSPVCPARRPDQIKCCWPTQEYRKKNLPSGDDQICPETGARSTQLLHACQKTFWQI